MARRRPTDDDADDDDRPKKKKKKKAAPVEEVEDEGAVDELDELDEEAAPAPPRPRENAYTGLLVITFLSLAVACGLLYSDFSELNASPVQPPSVTLPSLGAMPQPATPAPRGR